MLRLRFYGGIGFHVLPTVMAERDRIRSDARLGAHVKACGALLLEGPWRLDGPWVERRVGELSAWHDREGDCRVLAEAEAAWIEVLSERALATAGGAARGGAAVGAGVLEPAARQAVVADLAWFRTPGVGRQDSVTPRSSRSHSPSCGTVDPIGAGWNPGRSSRIQWGVRGHEQRAARRGVGAGPAGAGAA
jgi:hypothetical protein